MGEKRVFIWNIPFYTFSMGGKTSFHLEYCVWGIPVEHSKAAESTFEILIAGQNVKRKVFRQIKKIYNGNFLLVMMVSREKNPEKFFKCFTGTNYFLLLVDGFQEKIISGKVLKRWRKVLPPISPALSWVTPFPGKNAATFFIPTIILIFTDINNIVMIIINNITMMVNIIIIKLLLWKPFPRAPVLCCSSILCSSIPIPSRCLSSCPLSTAQLPS